MNEDTDLSDDITVQPLRIMSDIEASRLIDQYISSKHRCVSIAELAEHLVLPFEQIESIVESRSNGGHDNMV